MRPFHFMTISAFLAGAALLSAAAFGAEPRKLAGGRAQLAHLESDLKWWRASVASAEAINPRTAELAKAIDDFKIDIKELEEEIAHYCAAIKAEEARFRHDASESLNASWSVSAHATECRLVPCQTLLVYT